MFKCLVLCLFAVYLRGVHGSFAGEMVETTQLCCNQGTGYARNHTAEDCSSSIPPEVPSHLGTLCIFAMDQCCKEYFQKKKNCDADVDAALKNLSCDTNMDSTKSCCSECLRGTALGKEGDAGACNVPTRSNVAEDLLSTDAFVQCCIAAAKESNSDSKPEASSGNARAITLSRSSSTPTIASLCEEYAPNELCAHHCIPVPGSYRCECNPGFKLMADRRNCIEITKNRCKPKNPCQHKCIDNGIEVKCLCRRGYQLMADGKSCEDIDECTLDPPVCLSGTQCYNVQGSYKCIPHKKPANNNKPIELGKCPPGFTRNIINNVCDDVNECTLLHPPCPSYLCENTIGGYKCGGVSGDPSNLPKVFNKADDRCPPGFRSGITEECEDVDECALGQDDCNPLSQFCINTRGSFYCQNKASKHCPPGFKIDPRTSKCEDIDECEEANDLCRPDQICVNVPGEYDCRLKDDRKRLNKCPEGMRMKPGRSVCEDIDECMEGTHLCDQYQNCLNTNGSHECRCKLGFEHDPITGACTDVNECATDQHNCLSWSQRCDNTVGSFLCIRITPCGTGYILHHTTSECEDIDECALGIHNCDKAGSKYHCENIPGSFRCVKMRTTTSTTTTAQPEYEYYYDSEEETEDNATQPINQTDKNLETPAQTTTTLKPEPSELSPTPVKPTEPSSVASERNETPAVDVRFNNVEPEPTAPEINPTEPQIEVKPTETKEIEEPRPTEQEIKPTESEVKPTESRPEEPTTTEQYPQEREQSKPEEPPTFYDPFSPRPVSPNYNYYSNENQPDDRKPTRRPSFENSEKKISYDIRPTNRPYYEKIPEQTTDVFDNNESVDIASPTPPQVVLVNVGQDTAAIDGEKQDDGSVVVDTKEIPKNEWTKVNSKPSVNCQLGFESNSEGYCQDIDECATDRHSCLKASEICRNTLGGYLCDCAPGYRRDFISGVCDVITTSSTSTTTSTLPPTSSERHYFWGYPDYKSYTPKPFRHRNLCDVGFHYNTQSRACDDINECTNGQANCASVEICVNTVGGYRCDCPPNWRLDEVRHRCVHNRNPNQFPPGYKNEPVIPINPPLPEDISKGFNNPQYVEPEVKQVDDRGSISICPSGYTLGFDGSCEDIDECLSESVCENMLCTNLRGGYVCSCPPGHKLINNRCEDVNECALGGNMPVCSQNADCINTVGSYKCRCHEGFRSAPVNDKVCVDVDECTESPAGSLCEHRCNNVWGSYRCSCHRGYRLNPDNSTCSDIDECTEYKNKILCVGRCVNEPGSYRCTCPSGYRLSEDKRSCIDIDECETGEAPCADGSTYAGASDVCLNTRGGYRCHRIVCPSGYKLESRHRCTRIEKYCPPNDWECAHQPTTYSYNFITFVSNLYIPASKVDLFTMRGPAWPHAKMRFQLRLVDVNAPPSVKEKADINAFLLVQNNNQAVMSLIKSLEGPQSIELELSMELYNGDQFGGIAVARLYIYVSEYEY